MEIPGQISAEIDTFDGQAGWITPISINDGGGVTGSDYDSNAVAHGFVWTQKKQVVAFDAPGAGTGLFQGTYPFIINETFGVAGTVIDANNIAHGFLRNPEGKIKMLDVPGAGTSQACSFNGSTFTSFSGGTFVVDMNDTGVVVGAYADASTCILHAFVRSADGSLTSFDPPGPLVISSAFTFGKGLYVSQTGIVAGAYFEAIPGNPFGGNIRGFVRSPDGKIATFDAASYSPCCIWTLPSGISSSALVVGSFNDGYSINHGFVRTFNGSITVLDAPNAGSGPNQGTVPLGISSGGNVVGFLTDTNGISHGFVVR
jgi:hypothetical protein